jgi:dTDP-glucose pyrophosphorylase
MKHLSADRPKHLIPIEGKPVMEHVIERLKAAGITEIVLVVGHMCGMIQDYFGDGTKLGISIKYALQDPPTGTGSGVHAAEDLASDAPFLMTFGDVLTPSSTFQGMVQDFETNPCDALLLINWVEDPYRGAAVYIDDNGVISEVVEKPSVGTSTTHWNQSGSYIFSPEIFKYTAKLTPSARGEYELTHAVNAMIADGRTTHGYKLTGSWCDVGTPDDIAVAEKIVSE